MTHIYAHTGDGASVRTVGELFLNFRRGRLTSTFSYDNDYVGLPSAYSLEPALPLSSGNWPLGRALPRSFDDCSPDRWGRNLIAKRLRSDAADSGAALPTIDDRDFLLGVSDETRQGALRFTTEVGGEFQHPAHEVPKLIALPALMRAADHVARDDPGSLSAIKTLLDAGTGSLGGARPKASVRDGDRLLIAKFPHHSDQWNVMAWEKTALDLATAAGIEVPNAELVEIEGKAVLLSERFDRQGSERIGYISAMTLLEADDGQPRDYTEIAETVPEYSENTTSDLRQLWRRIAFSIAIHNTDDHLRNHGFLRGRSGWNLSPAFDINPNPDLAATRATSIGGASNPSQEVRALLSYSALFDLTVDEARRVLFEVTDAASRWATVAKHNGIASSEIRHFEPTLNSTIGIVRAG